jgi:hypothetical protein
MEAAVGASSANFAGEWLDAKFTALANTRCRDVLPDDLIDSAPRSHAKRQAGAYTRPLLTST